ncbi:MAG: hypothetical protein LDL24_04780 [Treponema sp.]|nr:hypothetical protein [Treponema sp.]
MRPVEHFLSDLNKRFQNKEPLEDGLTTDRLFIAFSSLVTPHLGLQGSEELFKYWKDSYTSQAVPDYLRLGYIAAFIVHEYDEGSMILSREDLEEIRDTLSSLADEMHIDTLTTLMAELVSRGLLDQ